MIVHLVSLSYLACYIIELETGNGFMTWFDLLSVVFLVRSFDHDSQDESGKLSLSKSGTCPSKP